MKLQQIVTVGILGALAPMSPSDADVASVEAASAALVTQAYAHADGFESIRVSQDLVVGSTALSLRLHDNGELALVSLLVPALPKEDNTIVAFWLGGSGSVPAASGDRPYLDVRTLKAA